jgi:cardiolipin synthase
VTYLGKAATFNLLYAFPLLLFGAGDGTWAEVARAVGWAFAWWGTGLYVYTGLDYLRQVADVVRDRRAALRASGPVAAPEPPGA